MIYGVKCSKCGLMQMPQSKCKSCGSPLEETPKAPPKLSSDPRPPRRIVPETADPVRPTEPAGAGWAAGETGGNRCSECGMEFSSEDLIRISGTQVCARCKPLIVQRLREGVVLAGEMTYAGFWIRFGAKMIDGIILSAVGFGLGFLGTMVSGEGVAGAVLQNLLYFALSVAYVTYFLGRYNATPGKMACGLKVVRPDNPKISYARALGREFAEFLSSVILCIGYIMAAFDQEKRALHDRICDTRVVKV